MSLSYYTNNDLWLKTQYHIQTHRHSNNIYKMITVPIVHYGAFISQKSQTTSVDSITVPLRGHEILGLLHTYVSTYIKICLYIMHKIHF